LLLRRLLKGADGFAIGCEAVLLQRFLDAAVEGADLQDLFRLLAGRDFAAELAGDAYKLFNLLDAAHLALSILGPKVVLDAAPNVQTHRHRHHVDRQNVEHRALERQHRAIWRRTQEVGEVVDVRRIHAPADGHPVHDQWALVDAAADHPLNGLEAVNVVELERALDSLGRETLDVFFGPSRAAGHDHLAIGIVVFGLRQVPSVQRRSFATC